MHPTLQAGHSTRNLHQGQTPPWSITTSAHTSQFLPGQWLDTYVPSTPKAGGFTITSTPSTAAQLPSGDETYPYLELAVQESPSNPPAAYLFRPIPDLLGKSLQVRVGGSFVFPPPSIPPASIHRVVFIAGGVGINPLISMVSRLAEKHGRIAETGEEVEVRFLYSTKLPAAADDGTSTQTAQVLFLERLAGFFARGEVRGRLTLFLTNHTPHNQGAISPHDTTIQTEKRRITKDDLSEAVDDGKYQTVVFICGVPGMTDEFVDILTSPEGLHLPPDRVFYEKWW